MRSLEELFIDKLKDIHDAERRITRALPKMIKNASSEELSDALQEHLDVTQQQIERLEEVFERLGKTPGRKTCHGMMGILEEGAEVMEKEASPDVLDAALIASAQEVEHYEIGAYGCLRTWAEVLGRSDEARLLEQTLKEEKQADEKLNQLAETINQQAMREGEEEDEVTTTSSGGSRRRGNGAARAAGGRKASSR